MAVIGGAAGGHLPQITITNGMTWVPPMDGNVCIHLVGAGGGGVGSNTGSCGSGGAGGYCKKNSLAVTTAGSFTIVIGVGGKGSSSANDASDGGNTTVAGTGLGSTLTANGGTGGNSGSAGLGGSAANGDVNNTGGAGVGADSGGCGGSVGIFATGNHGYSRAISSYGPTGTYCDAAGGGLSMSGYGHIVGGTHGGMAPWGNTSMGEGARLDGDDLCGGGRAYTSAATYIFGGNGGIGGGGGIARYTTDAGYCWGGSGGDGIVLIQYLP